jgi:hypothetical protein
MINKFNVSIAPDGGTLYAETNLHHLFPEPLNTITSAFFCIMALMWILRLNGFSKEYFFLSVASYVLLIGGIGGTIYHGLRQYSIFIFMDWVPILLLCMMASAYFWVKILNNWLYALVILIAFFTIQVFIRFQVSDDHLATNLNYAVLAVTVVLPVIIFLVKNRSRQSGWFFLSILFFCIALFFRIIDNWKMLITGTHFLWHTFGCLASYCMFMFMYQLANKEGLIASKAAL